MAVLLAQSIQSNVRELEGALIRLAAKSSLTGRAIDVEFTKSELLMVSPRRPELMSVEDIQRAVCSHFRLSNAELLSKDRHKSVAFARQAYNDSVTQYNTYRQTFPPVLFAGMLGHGQDAELLDFDDAQIADAPKVSFT